MERADVSRPILGGFAATIAMTMMMYAAPMMGMPKMDVAGMLGSALGGSWWMGMTMHLINGIVIFPLVYAFLLGGALPGGAWLKGVQWGLILWFLAQAVVMPMMGMGFFSSVTPAPMKNVMGSFLGHLIYGAILGAITGAPGVAASSAGNERFPSGLRKTG